MKEKKTLDVHISKGMRHGEKLTFHGEADESPDTVPGNVVVVLQQKDHDVFERKGADLYMRKHISLVEALTGFSFPIHHSPLTGPWILEGISEGLAGYSLMGWGAEKMGMFLPDQLPSPARPVTPLGGYSNLLH